MLHFSLYLFGHDGAVRRNDHIVGYLLLQSQPTLQITMIDVCIESMRKLDFVLEFYLPLLDHTQWGAYERCSPCLLSKPLLGRS